MIRFVLKSVVYLGLILLALELLIRAFHLYVDDRPSYIDRFGVHKRVPGSRGHYVTGNRRQNFTEFSINKFGFNSHREFTPTEDKYEVALVGDSFIEGFHQDYNNSLGKKIENHLPEVEVYEYGISNADMASQLYLTKAYKEHFKKIDKIFYYLKFENDFERGEYKPDYALVDYRSSQLYHIRQKCKLWVYGSRIGFVEPIKLLGNSILEFIGNLSGKKIILKANDTEKIKGDFVTKRLLNFQELIEAYGLDKENTVLLFDGRVTDDRFLDFCDENNIRYLDFSKAFQKAKAPVTLVYDKHWNDYGRELIAEVIADYLQKEVSP